MTELNNPEVSVVMSLYNGIAFLDAAVESVLAQSIGHWELLIVDDGSTDVSLDRARHWAARDSRIRVLRHPGGVNRGVSATRNLGIAEARADYIALLDCDDLWLPEKLAHQLPVAREHPEVALIYSKARVVDDAGTPVDGSRSGLARPPVFGNGNPGRPTNDFVGYLDFKYWVPASSALFSRKAAAAYGNFDETLGYQVEDNLLWAQLAECGAMWFQDEILIYYRVHGNQWNSRMDVCRKWQSRFAYLSALNRTVGPGNRTATARVLVEFGFDGLARALISSRAIRPIALLGYWARLLGQPGVSWSLRGRATMTLVRQIVFIPFKAIQFTRRTLVRT